MSPSRHILPDSSVILEYIHAHQDADGHFTSTSSNTIFTTAFILTSLASCSDSVRQHALYKKITDRGCDYLERQMNPTWTWNYWHKDHPNAADIMPYPDDIDDTSLCLAALSHIRPDTLTGDAWAIIVKALTTSELAVGGPYNTWILKTNPTSPWRDLDPAVNSNLGYFLSLHDISLPNLITYIESIIAHQKYSSRYYSSPIVILYFISRFYKGKFAVKAYQYLTTYIKKNSRKLATNTLELSLACSALIRLRAPRSIITALMKRLSLKQIHFEPHGLYIEDPRTGIAMSGSSALTAAAYLEAISLFELKFESHTTQLRTSQMPAKDTILDNALASDAETIYNKALNQIHQILKQASPDIRNLASETLIKILEHSNGSDIILLPYFFIKSLDPKLANKIPQNTIIKLGIANTLGWISYTLYDGVFDNESSPEHISTANVCLRELTVLYKDTLTHKNFPIFTRITNTIDEANRWERSHCYIPAIGANHKLPLPDYEDHHILAHKSLGHALSPLAILTLLDIAPASHEFKNLEKFFIHYLIARQLNDDAHDWEEDLGRGFLNSSSTHTLEVWRKKFISSRKPYSPPTTDDLRKIFWDSTIDTVAANIINHCNTARNALHKMTCVKQPKILEALIDKLEKIARTTENEGAFTRSFLNTYGASTTSNGKTRKTKR